MGANRTGWKNGFRPEELKQEPIANFQGNFFLTV